MNSLSVTQNVRLEDLAVQDGAELLVLLKRAGTGEAKFGDVRALLTLREREGRSCTSLEAFELLRKNDSVFQGTLDKAWSIMLTGDVPKGDGVAAVPAVEDRIIAMKKATGGRTLAEVMKDKATGGRKTTDSEIPTIPEVPTIKPFTPTSAPTPPAPPPTPTPKIGPQEPVDPRQQQTPGPGPITGDTPSPAPATAQPQQQQPTPKKKP